MKFRKMRGVMPVVILLVLAGIVAFGAYDMIVKKEEQSSFGEGNLKEDNFGTDKQNSEKEQTEPEVQGAEEEAAADAVKGQKTEVAGDEAKKQEAENNWEGSEGVFEIHKISDEIFSRIKGKSYKENCDIALEDLRYLRLSYYGFDEKTHLGEMIVNAAIAEDTADVFRELYEACYPIERMELVDEYEADDIASMEANNTSAFNFRYIDGTTRYSNHAMGFAIDINPLYNPYVRNKNGGEDVLPVTAEAYADRRADCAYYIEKDDICYQIFTKYGFSWGGEWKNSKDYQHFEKILD